jgi:hypothetical protein
VTAEPGSPNRQPSTRRLDSTIETPFCQLAAVAFLAVTGAVQATAGWLAADVVKMRLATVVAVAAPAGQALERGLGGLPVAAAAWRRPARLGAQ